MIGCLQFASIFFIIIAATLVVGVALQEISNLCLWAWNVLESSWSGITQKVAHGLYQGRRPLTASR